jgi:hypothetical protein
MNSGGSVTHWIQLVQAGDEDAARHLGALFPASGRIGPQEAARGRTPGALMRKTSH